ncbi:hypothetical protein K0U91_09150 [Chryseobacterium chendengshani]|uniref:hypothetical protein n=1 Tax=Chryseobacterium sp. LJ668 TaxID=2864040 RepID=UPI001C68D342|nr:hypothetical protein [Chryseobacterium sp. LJ668]MBW8524515.1 hypothetical protein [Chryseobacterium sp. LJ668]QYK15243.1 hypothetical protein K0U91_09150 [Chryseobacterium sp. LJ668]
MAKQKPKSERSNNFVFKGVEVWFEKYVLNIGKNGGLEIQDVEFVIEWKNRSDENGFMFMVNSCGFLKL